MERLVEACGGVHPPTATNNYAFIMCSGKELFLKLPEAPLAERYPIFQRYESF